MSHQHWRTGVKSLVEFCCRQGNLGYTEAPAARAEQGQMAQRRLQAQTPPGYRKEVAVEQTASHHGITLIITGRIDGLWEQDGQLFLEEIKSTYFHDSTLPSPLFQVHQAQALCYAAMLPTAEAYASVTVRVTYFQLKDETSFHREHVFSLNEVQQKFAAWTADYCAWLAKVALHRQQRDAWAKALNFPFPHYRRGQRALAVTAWRYLRDRKIALLEAPTGAGKTISVLFPALKRFADNPELRIFYLTAKNSGQRTVMQTLQRAQASNSLLNVYLTAKTQICPCLNNASKNTLQPSNADECQRCVGYYDRRRPALEQALEYKTLNAQTLLTLGDTFAVCPHQLAMDLCEWADFIVADFNYLFDPFTRQSMGDAFHTHSILLVDEAHNLPERARAMYSCALTVKQLESVLAHSPPGNVSKAMRALIKQCRLVAENVMVENSSRDTHAGAEIPKTLAFSLQTALETLRQWMDEQPLLLNDDRLDTWLAIFSMQRAFDHWGEHYCLMHANADEPVRISAYCLDPGFFLAEIFEDSAGALLFSGTLQPTTWFSDTLGLQRLPVSRQGEAFSIEHALENTHVKAAILALPMQYSSRQQSLPVALPYLCALLKTHPGRYLVAAASFEILGQLGEALQTLLPSYTWLIQHSESTEAERNAFLNAFTTREHSAALVISGGVFAEGIDLADTPLQGVIQVGLPMPPPSEERKRLQAYHQTQSGHGFEYTYSYPAIARTLQTCGRLLRKDGDRGCLLLIDARFLRAPYAGFLPEHWRTRRVNSVEAMLGFVDETPC